LREAVGARDSNLVLADATIDTEIFNTIVREGAAKLPGIVDFTDDPIVSSDVLGSTLSLLFDMQATEKAGKHIIKALGWYENLGRAVFRILEQQPGIEITAINDLFDPGALRYLLAYDTVMGGFGHPLRLEDNCLVTPNNRSRLLCEKNPLNLPWSDMGIDVVVESTGVFRKRAQLEQHLTAGARKVVLTVPAAEPIDYTVVLGVNDSGLTSEHKIISNASCTTNCLAPMAKVLNDAFGIEEGMINTVHAYTNDQRLADVPHSDWRRSRKHHSHFYWRCESRRRSIAGTKRQTAWHRLPRSGTGWLGSGFVRAVGDAGDCGRHPRRCACSCGFAGNGRHSAICRQAIGIHRHHRQLAFIHLRRGVHASERWQVHPCA
jgi:glyceraldehyde-3-phosphate dehydrogenase/erythrose-4-phosphate dehydrogenase